MTINKLKKLGLLLEQAELFNLSVKIPRLIREINAAPTRETGVEISDWGSFLDWWGKNRSQGLVYVFTDAFGEGSEEVQQVKELIDEAEEHERKLNDFYMMLRRKAQEQNAPAPIKEDLELEPDNVVLDEESEIDENLEDLEDEKEDDKDTEEDKNDEKDDEEEDLDLESTE